MATWYVLAALAVRAVWSLLNRGSRQLWAWATAAVATFGTIVQFSGGSNDVCLSVRIDTINELNAASEPTRPLSVASAYVEVVLRATNLSGGMIKCWALTRVAGRRNPARWQHQALMGTGSKETGNRDVPDCLGPVQLPGGQGSDIELVGVLMRSGATPNHPEDGAAWSQTVWIRRGALEAARAERPQPGPSAGSWLYLGDAPYADVAATDSHHIFASAMWWGMEPPVRASIRWDSDSDWQSIDVDAGEVVGHVYQEAGGKDVVLRLRSGDQSEHYALARITILPKEGEDR